MDTLQPHLGVDDVARLLDGPSHDPIPFLAAKHLRACRECRELLLGSAIEVGCLKARGSEFEPPSEALVAIGMDIAALADRGDGGVERPAVLRPRPHWMIRFAAVAAAFVFVVLAGFFVMRSIEPGGQTRLGTDVIRPVQAAVGAFSNLRDLVIPGGEAFIGREVTAYRSTGRLGDDDLDASLDILLERFRAEDSSSDAAYWLVAGYVASGKVGKARVCAEWARERFPSDPRLVVLDAIAAFMDGEYDDSEALLRRVIDEDANGMLGAVARVDLAVVLRQQGRAAEAMAILGEVRERYSGTPIAGKAGMLSSSAK